MRSQTVLKFALLLSLSIAMVAPVSAATAEDSITARWEVQQIKFHFSGFSSYYSCLSLRSKIKKLLKHFGAQKPRVDGPCMGSYHNPQRFHRLVLAFAVPVPVAASGEISEGVLATDTFNAVWEQRQIRNNRPRYIDGGDCELIEEIRRQVLPHFAVQGLDQGLKCIPHRRTLGGTATNLLVLQPVDKELVPPELPAVFEVGELPGVEDDVPGAEESETETD
jgi:hypothetical protein